MIVEALIYDAFSKVPGTGNPAGDTLSGNKLSDDQMKFVNACIR